MKTNTDFIKELAQKMKAQDNRATQYPLYYVYEKEERWVDGDDSWDFKLWLDEDYNETERMAGHDWDDELSERYDDEWGNTAFVREVDVPVVDVGPFFTEEAAQQHIDQNGYHYTKPFVYVNSAWRNYEMQQVLKTIFELAGEKVPSHYD